MKGSLQGQGLLAFYLARNPFSMKDEIYFLPKKSALSFLLLNLQQVLAQLLLQMR